MNTLKHQGSCEVEATLAEDDELGIEHQVLGHLGGRRGDLWK
ncbi:hypothetical protein [Streptomyces sp. NBC_01334]|nr:hypothetical protein OG736_45630 [Streptomyces sp. NBC_01334]